MEMLHNTAIRFIALSAYVAMFNSVAIAQNRMSFRCADDQYEYTDSSDNIECRQCSTCPQGFGVIKLCSFHNDTICEACPRGSYSVSNSRRDSCLRCRECESHQLTRTECTTINNRECSRSCSTGYYFDNIANRCYKCGYCYSGYGTPVRLSECNVHGVLRDYQCMIIRNIPSYNPHHGWFRDHGQGTMDIENSHNTEMTTEKFIDTTELQSSILNTIVEDLTTISDIIADPKREKHPVTLANISVNNVVPDTREDAHNARNNMIIIGITVSIIVAVMFVAYYLRHHNKTNYINKCLEGTKNEINYIKLPIKAPLSILFSNVLKTEIASSEGIDSAPV